MKNQFYRLYLLIVFAFATAIYSFSSLYDRYDQSEWISADHVFNEFDVSTKKFNNETIPNSILIKLNGGEIVRLSSENQTYFLRKNDPDAIESAGPFPNQVMPVVSEYLLFGLYFVLGIILLLLIWPLFRDLAKLQNISWKIHQTGTVESRELNQFSSMSAVAPLSNTFKEMLEKIKFLLETQEELSKIVAHDVRTPLSRMKFVMQGIRAGKANERKDYYADRLEQDILEIEELTENYLSFVKVDQINKVEESQVIYTHEWLAMIAPVKSFNGSDYVHLTLELKVHSDTLLGHKVLLERCISNLIQNSMRFAKSVIRVTIGSYKENYWIRVEDDGEGFIENNKQSNHKGYGLGLLICNRIAQWHGGILLMQSSSALGGAKVEIQWPK